MSDDSLTPPASDPFSAFEGRSKRPLSQSNTLFGVKRGYYYMGVAVLLITIGIVWYYRLPITEWWKKTFKSAPAPELDSKKEEKKIPEKLPELAGIKQVVPPVEQSEMPPPPPVVVASPQSEKVEKVAEAASAAPSASAVQTSKKRMKSSQHHDKVAGSKTHQGLTPKIPYQLCTAEAQGRFVASTFVWSINPATRKAKCDAWVRKITAAQAKKHSPS